MDKMDKMDGMDTMDALPRAAVVGRELGELTADAHTGSGVNFRLSSCGKQLAAARRSSLPMSSWLGMPPSFGSCFRAEDDYAWATHTQRDAPLYEEEVVEVFLDPVGDLACYFEIEVNPLNTVLDLVLRRNRSGYVKDIAWQCEGLRTAILAGPKFWCAELSIPFASLTSERPTAGARWRANFLRIDRPHDSARELSAWSPTSYPNFHLPERFGFIEFVDRER